MISRLVRCRSLSLPPAASDASLTPFRPSLGEGDGVKRQINALTREQSYYSEKIAQDSTLLERLKYDDYLEEYARENYHMQGRNEHVYIIRE